MADKKLVSLINSLLKGIDGELSSQRVTWAINSPKCLCDPCYQSWLEWGRSLYSDHIEVYQRRVKEEEVHREQRRVH